MGVTSSPARKEEIAVANRGPLARLRRRVLRRRLRLLARRILSPPAGLRLPKANTQTRTQLKAHGFRERGVQNTSIIHSGFADNDLEPARKRPTPCRAELAQVTLR